MVGKPILIVEDDRDIRENLRELFEIMGYAVFLAANGKEALDLLRSGTLNPGVILLDLAMPIMDGKTFLAELEQDGKVSKPPVVVMTASPDRPLNQIAGFIKKPYDIHQVLAVAARYCSAGPQPKQETG
jgi:CheY-like chemotaxis protein